MTTDVEKLHMELAELKKQNARLKLLESRSFEAITIYNDQLICIDANGQTSKLFQYAQEDIIGMKGLDFFAPESRDGILEKVRAGYDKPYEALMLRKDGSKFWGLIQGSSIVLNGVRHRVSTCRDITIQKKAQDDLLRLNHELESVYNNSQAGIFLLNNDRIVIRVNCEAIRMFGYDLVSDMIGLDMREIHLSEENYKYFGEFYSEALLEHRVIKLDYQFKRKSGEVFWANVSGSAVDKAIPPDLSMGIVWAFFDISGRKEMELKLQEQNEELNTLNADLQTHNDNKDKFISILAHDIKSPLSGALNFSELLIDNFDSFDLPSLKEQMVAVSSSIRKTYDLLEEILFWNKSQLGRMQVKLVDMDFMKSAKVVVDQLQGRALEKNISISCFVSEDIVLKADEDLFKIILRNLVTNAIKFTNKGGRIKVFALRDGLNAVVKVSDNGVGIKEEQLSKIWTIEEDVSTFGTENETGTGMGLILCKELVTSLGGEIWVKSVFRQGSEFSFSLPLVS